MRAFLTLVLSCAVAAAVAFGAVEFARWRQAGEAAKPAAPPPVVVSVATAKAEDVPLILRGLGAVTAFNTVDIRSRVVGNIIKVNFVEGEEVKAGDLLIELDPRPFEAALDQATAALARDQANLSGARSDLARYAGLVHKNYISQQQYTNQAATVHADEATVAVDKAAIDSAKLNLEYAKITSPIDGVTGIRQADLGDLVQPNTQTLLVVTQIKPIYVIFSLPEEMIPRIRRAMSKRRLTVQAFDASDENRLSTGVLNLIDNQVDQATGTVKLKAEFTNDDKILWPGQFVNAHLVAEVVKNGVTVPSVAVQAGPEGSFVFVVKPDDTVEPHAVRVLQTERNVSLLESGLGPGARVVTAGQSRLTAGAKVSIAASDEGAPATPSPEPAGAVLE